MNDEFYKKFPSFNENSKENRRHRKLVVDYNAFLQSREEVTGKTQQKKPTKIPVAKQLNQQDDSNDVFCVEERNSRDASESRERKLSYQKILLQQIEETKVRRKSQKEREMENERLLEERLQKQIESMSIKPKDPWTNRPVERISFSENEKYQPPRTNKVYRYFSKSSNSLFSYKDNTFDDLEIIKYGNCEQCNKKIQILCNQCKSSASPIEEAKFIRRNRTSPIEVLESTRRNLRTSPILTPKITRRNLRTTQKQKPLKVKDNYLPYTFDTTVRYQKSSLRDMNNYNYSKLFDDFKNQKIVKKKEKVDVEKKEAPANKIEDLLGSNHQQYTVITGYAKSLLEKA